MEHPQSPKELSARMKELLESRNAASDMLSRYDDPDLNAVAQSAADQLDALAEKIEHPNEAAKRAERMKEIADTIPEFKNLITSLPATPATYEKSGDGYHLYLILEGFLQQEGFDEMKSHRPTTDERRNGNRLYEGRQLTDIINTIGSIKTASRLIVNAQTLEKDTMIHAMERVTEALRLDVMYGREHNLDAADLLKRAHDRTSESEIDYTDPLALMSMEIQKTFEKHNVPVPLNIKAYTKNVDQATGGDFGLFSKATNGPLKEVLRTPEDLIKIIKIYKKNPGVEINGDATILISLGHLTLDQLDGPMLKKLSVLSIRIFLATTQVLSLIRPFRPIVPY